MKEGNVLMIMLGVIIVGMLIMFFGCATPQKPKDMGWQGNSMDGCIVMQLEREDGTFIDNSPEAKEAEEKAKRKAEFMRKSGFH